MSSDEAPDRSYQRTLVDQANAEMGRQRLSRRELARITGIHRNSLDRIFSCTRDLNVTQWDAIAHALGFDPGELARAAGDEAARRAALNLAVLPEANRLIDESDKLTKRQRSELREALRSGSREPGRSNPGESVDSSARRRGRAGAG
jgi:hypothetical protein